MGTTLVHDVFFVLTKLSSSSRAIICYFIATMADVLDVAYAYQAGDIRAHTY